MRFPLLISLTLLASPSPVLADAVDGSDSIIVTGTLHRSQQDVLQGTTSLSDAQLQARLRATIGETLVSTPGVSSSSFAPGASRPVIRGLQGDRVRVLIDGIGSIDASSASADHAVAGDTLTASRVEVLRGPATLQYGSSAIGGVVNIIEGSLEPGTQPKRLVTALYGSAATERAFAGLIEAPLSEGVKLHADASYRDSDDLKVGGPLVSRPLAQLLGIDRSQLTDRTQHNSDARTRNYGLGITLATNGGADFFGIKVGRFLTNYGSPIEETVRIDLKQTRVDAKAQLSFDDGLVEKAQWRLGWANYKHAELEGKEIGTTFKNTGWESRLDFIQTDRGGWRGAFGLQYSRRGADTCSFSSSRATWARFVPGGRSRPCGKRRYG